MNDFAMAAVGVFAIVASLAVLALVLYVALLLRERIQEDDDTTLAEARIKALIAKLGGQTEKVTAATQAVNTIEPTEGEGNA